jgi:hypothetical protein
LVLLLLLLFSYRRVWFLPLLPAMLSFASLMNFLYAKRHEQPAFRRS